MSKVVKPASTYGPIACLATSGSSVRPPRSMSATCQSPVITRETVSPGASVWRSILGSLLRREGQESRAEIWHPALERSALAPVDRARQKQHDEPDGRRAEIPCSGRRGEIAPGLRREEGGEHDRADGGEGDLYGARWDHAHVAG